jgi:hypothetical protein
VKRDWSLARAKCDAEGGCRNCGFPRVEAAHIVGREHDDDPPLRAEELPWWRPGIVAPDRVLGLCHDCHQGPQGVHAKRLDLLPLLTLDEQLQAVADAGGIGRAYDLLMPSASPKRVFVVDQEVSG